MGQTIPEEPGQPGRSRAFEARLQEQMAAAVEQHRFAEEARARAIRIKQQARAARELLARDPDLRSDMRRTAFDVIPAPAAVIGRKGRVLVANSRWRSAFGSDLSVGCDFFAGWPSAEANPVVPQGVKQVLDGGAGVDVDTNLAEGRRVTVQVAPTASEVGAALVVVIDITEQYQESQQLLFDATHDDLTGLANRAFLARQLENALAALRRYGQRFGLVYLDLDGFKPINDTYGHPAGDRLLREVAKRWSVIVRAPDILARVGGDEFVALVSRLEDESYLRAIAARFQDALRQPFQIEGAPEINLSVTAGVVTPTAGMTPEEAVAAADHAMYTNKSCRTDRPGRRAE